MSLSSRLPLVGHSVGADGRLLSPGDAEELLRRVDELCDENEMLGRELLRCYDQLNLVFEITDNIANFDDPNVIEDAVLRRWGQMLDSAAAYVDDGAGCRRLETHGRDVRPLELPADVVEQALAGEIQRTRARRHSLLPTLDDATTQKLEGAQVLLAALPRLGESVRVGVVLRRPDQNRFDARDVLASDSVLCYGGHVLSNLLMVQRLQGAAFETVRALANAIDAKDRYTCGHSERVGFLARLLGQSLGLGPAQLQALEWAGILHDVGKIGISEEILNKCGRLTPEEYAEIKRHPELSYDVLKPVASFRPVLNAALHHHENHDGSGYPAGLRGDEIPIEAQIVHVADIFDALTSTRSYRKGYDLDQAFKILADGAGSVTNPDVTAAFVKAFHDFMRDEADEFGRRFAHIQDGLNNPSSDPADATSDDTHRDADAGDTRA